MDEVVTIIEVIVQNTMNTWSYHKAIVYVICKDTLNNCVPTTRDNKRDNNKLHHQPTHTTLTTFKQVAINEIIHFITGNDGRG